MSMANHTLPSTRRWLRTEVVLALALLGCVAAAAFYTHTALFHAWVCSRVVASLERITGGKVELQSFNWDLWKLQFEARNLTIHGRENPREAPYAHVERLLFRAGIPSVLAGRIALRYLELDHPVLHLIVYPDGATNQPQPRRPQGSVHSPVEPVFDLGIRQVRIDRGVFLLNERPLPLDVNAEDVKFSLSWLRREDRWDGQLRFGQCVARYGDLGVLPASLAAHFSLWRNRARLDSAEVGLGRANLKLSGELQDFTRPTVHINYTAEVAAAQLGSWLHLPELRSGSIEAAGEATAIESHWVAQGKLLFRDLEYAARGFHPSAINGGAEFAASEKRITLPHIALAVLGGTALGNAEISPLGRTASKGRTAPRGPEANVHLKVYGLLLPRVLECLTPPSLPFRRFRPAGRMEGTVGIRGTVTPATLVVSLALDAAPPPVAAPGELPVALHFEGSYDDVARELTLANLNLSTPASQLSARGKLSYRGGVVQFSAATTQLSEWIGAVAGSRAAAVWPLDVKGRVGLEGTFIGPIETPRVAGRLQLSDFATLADVNQWFATTVPPTLSRPAQWLPWEGLTGDVEYSSSSFSLHHAVLRQGPARIDLDLSLPLAQGRLARDAPVGARFVLHQADLAEVQVLAGYSYPAAGTLEGNLQVSGTLAAPSVAGNLVLRKASIYGETLELARANLELSPEQLRLNELEIAQDGGRIIGKLNYQFATHAYTLDLLGKNLELAKIRRLQTGRMALSGLLGFTAHGSGTTDAPALDAELECTNLIANGVRAGGLRLSATTQGETLRLSGRAQSAASDVAFQGSVRLRGDFPANLELRLIRADLEPLLRMGLPLRTAGHSELSGIIQAVGPLRSPGDLTVTANLDRAAADFERIELHNDGAIRFAIAQHTLEIEQLRLAGNETALAAEGTAQLSGNGALDIRASGQVNLKLLKSLDPSIVSQGGLSLDLRLRGTLRQPRINGRVDVSGAAIAHVDLPNGLSDLNGRLVFSEDRLQVQRLTGKTGGGAISIEGYASYGPTLGLNLRAKGQDIRLRYPPGVSSMADADLRLTGSYASALLSGDVTVTRFGVNPQFDFASYLAQAKQGERAPDPRSLPARVRLDVRVLSTPELQVQTSLAKVSGDVDLRVRGVASRPVLLGRINIVEGDIEFNATKYHLERGGITFNNPITTQPVLDLEATTTVRDYDITLGFHGPADRLSTTYRSDPPLATADIVSLLAFGRTREETAAQSAQTASNLTPETQSILYQALNAAVSSRIQKLFGVSRIKIDPQAGGAESNPAGPRLTIEQQVASNLTLTYITDVARANYQTIQAEYNLSRNVSVVAIRDWNGVVSFDIRIRQRHR
jgi:translocation and assembly module TamB